MAAQVARPLVAPARTQALLRGRGPGVSLPAGAPNSPSAGPPPRLTASPQPFPPLPVSRSCPLPPWRVGATATHPPHGAGAVRAGRGRRAGRTGRAGEAHRRPGALRCPRPHTRAPRPPTAGGGGDGGAPGRRRQWRRRRRLGTRSRPSRAGARAPALSCSATSRRYRNLRGPSAGLESYR